MSAEERADQPGNATWRASSAETIEADLAALWQEEGRSGPVSRALMSNLVVVSARRAFPAVEEVAQRHPARTILLGYTAGAEDAQPPEAARVGVLTFGESDTRYGVELIAVHTVSSAESIPSIVRGLTRGDVPTTVWWAGDLSSPSAPPAVTTMGRQLVYDSALWRSVKDGVSAVAALLQSRHAPDVADLNWRRLGPLRRALIYSLSGAAADLTGARVLVKHRTGESPAGWLMASWLSEGLGQKTIDRDAVSEGTLEGSSDILSVTLAARGWTLTASMSPEHVHVEGPKRTPFALMVPHEEEADAVASELRTLGHDIGLRRAILHLSRSASQIDQG